MLSYIVKRILSAIPVLLIVSIVIFLIIHITPGNPASVILGEEATPAQIAELEESLGLNLPIHQQYFSWIAGVFQGDLGTSYFMRAPVTDAIANSIVPTISLAIFAQIIALFIAIPIGVLAANKRGSLTDSSMMVFALLGMSIPSFLLALLLVLLFGVQLVWLSGRSEEQTLALQS